MPTIRYLTHRLNIISDSNMKLVLKTCLRPKIILAHFPDTVFLMVAFSTVLEVEIALAECVHFKKTLGKDKHNLI